MKDNMQIKGRYKIVLEDVNTGEKEITYVENLVPTVGLNAIVQQIVGTNTVEMDFTYLALGSGTSTPVLADTVLETEVVRSAIGIRSGSGAIATLQVFFTTAQANGTHKEVAIFGDGAGSTASGTVDTGILYSRALVNIVKTSAKTLTITYTFTIS